MSSAYLLIPLGLVLMAAAVAALFWAIDSGQYEDLEESSRAPLQEDLPPPPVDAKSIDDSSPDAPRR